jgi:hypothetical protein
MTLYVLRFILFDRGSILSMERLCLSEPERDESGVECPGIISTLTLILILITREYQGEDYRSDER